MQSVDAIDFGAGHGIALREVRLKTGPCDYLLLVDRKPVGVIEAKKEGTTPSGVAEQSARYAANVPVFLAAGLEGPLPFLYESTGVETLFRDQRDPDSRSRRVFAFHRPETLAEWAAESDTLRARLKVMPISHPIATAGMRDCQIEAINGLEKSLAEDRPRALIHMATGAGKTFTACAFAYADRTQAQLQRRASAIGESTATIIARQLTRKKHPEQTYRSSLGILRLAKDYSSTQLEAACRRALELNILSYRSVRDLINLVPRPPRATPPVVTHDNVRGPDYFGGGHAH